MDGWCCIEAWRQVRDFDGQPNQLRVILAKGPGTFAARKDCEWRSLSGWLVTLHENGIEWGFSTMVLCIVGRPTPVGPETSLSWL